MTTRGLVAAHGASKTSIRYDCSNSASGERRCLVGQRSPGQDMETDTATALEAFLLDVSSGLYIEAYFSRRLAEEFRRAVRYRQPLGLAWIELSGLDGLSPDEQAGARVELARLLARLVRRADLAAVTKGTALTALLPCTAQRGLETFARRLNARFVERLQPLLIEQGAREPRLLVGGVSLPNPAVESPEDFIERAQIDLRCPTDRPTGPSPSYPLEEMPVLSDESGSWDEPLTDPGPLTDSAGRLS